jgi:hypothetical protein
LEVHQEGLEGEGLALDGDLERQGGVTVATPGVEKNKCDTRSPGLGLWHVDSHRVFVFRFHYLLFAQSVTQDSYSFFYIPSQAVKHCLPQFAAE